RGWRNPPRHDRIALSRRPWHIPRRSSRKLGTIPPYGSAVDHTFAAGTGNMPGTAGERYPIVTRRIPPTPGRSRAVGRRWRGVRGPDGGVRSPAAPETRPGGAGRGAGAGR